jgi:hypothetical protein
LDINGAKVLKKRLGPNGQFDPQPARGDADVTEDAPPVYQWLGVTPPASSERRGDDDEGATVVSRLQRLGLGFR